MKTEIPTTETSAGTLDPQARGVVTWRERQLLGAGFDLGLAASLAANCSVDLHRLIDLVERGCPPELAARIVAPLEGERRPC